MDGNIFVMQDVEWGVRSFEFKFLYSEIRNPKSEIDKGVL